MNTLLQKLIFFIASIIIIAASNTATASHYTGAEIQYKCVGTNKYIFTLVIIRDCQGADMFTAEDLTLTNTCTGKQVTLLCNAPSKNGWSPDAIEIAQLCPGQKSACQGGNQPGFEMISYYSDTITIAPDMLAYCCSMNPYGQRDTVKLTTPCANWTVAWYSGINNRNNTVNTTGGKMYAEITFNNQLIPSSNSPVFTSRPIPFVCVNQPLNYSYGVIASDVAVKLRYSLIGARGFDVNTAGWPIINLTYNSGYSATSPIQGIKIDSLTGQVTFTPTTIGKFIVVVQVREYDNSGNLVSTIIRDMEFIVQNCSNKAPDAAPTGSIRNLKNISGTTTQKDSFALEMCTGSTFSFDAVFTDQNTGDSLALITNIKDALPGATITTTGKNPLTATITWTAKEAWKNHLLIATVRDNACPVFGEQVFVYNMNVLEKTLTGADQTICSTDSAHLIASGGSVFTWSVLSGDAISVPSNFTCNPCANPVAKPSKTTTYVVTSNLSTCANKDTVTVSVITTIPSKITRITKPFCSIDTVYTFSAAPSGGKWSGKGITDSINGKFNPAAMGAASSLITYSLGGCSGKDTMTVFIKTPPSIKITDVGTFCSTDASITLSVNVSGGTWSGNGITNANTGAFNPASAKIGKDTISYTITDAITLFGKCGGYDTTVIKVDTFPDIKATGPFCASDATIKQLVATPAGGTWSGKGIVRDSSGTYQPSKAGAGKDTVIYTTSGKCNKDTIIITINQTPKAAITAAGPFCDNNAPVSLIATPSGGTWNGNGISGGTFSPSQAGIGTHKIIYNVTQSGCSDSNNISITVIKTPAAPSISKSASVCKGEIPSNFTASGTGGTIKWYSDLSLQNQVGTGNSYTPSVTSDATFWATETAGGLCTGAAGTGNVVFKPLPTTPTITANGVTTFCQGNSVILTSSTANSYLWSNSATTSSITAKTAGNYTVKVTDINGCSATSIATTVTVNSLPQIPTITQNGNTLMSSATTGNQWYFNGNIINSATSQFCTATQNGFYSVKVTVNGCSSTSSNVSITVGIEEVSINSTITVSPNPNNGKFTINMVDVRGQMADVKFAVYNVLGERVYSATNLQITKLSNLQIDLSALPAGIYFLQVNTGEEIVNRKLVLEK